LKFAAKALLGLLAPRDSGIAFGFGCLEGTETDSALLEEDKKRVPAHLSLTYERHFVKDLTANAAISDRRKLKIGLIFPPRFRGTRDGG